MKYLQKKKLISWSSSGGVFIDNLRTVDVGKLNVSILPHSCWSRFRPRVSSKRSLDELSLANASEVCATLTRSLKTALVDKNGLCFLCNCCRIFSQYKHYGSWKLPVNMLIMSVVNSDICLDVAQLGSSSRPDLASQQLAQSQHLIVPHNGSGDGWLSPIVIGRCLVFRYTLISIYLMALQDITSH